MSASIDREIKKLIDAGYADALSIIKKHRNDMDTVAEALVKKETLEGDEFETLLGGPKKRIS